MSSPEPLEFFVRRAHAEDAEPVLGVQRSAVTGLCVGDYTPEQIDAWTGYKAADFAARIGQGGLFLVAESFEQVVGFICYQGGEVASLYVDPACAGQGVGTALLREVEVQARRQMLAQIRLNSSLTAQGFYERRGYREVERVLYHTPSGVGVPCVKMVKRLGGL